MEGIIIWLLPFEKCREDILGGHLILSTGGDDININQFSRRLEELLRVVVLPGFSIPCSKLFLMFLQILRPVARVTAVRVDRKISLIPWIHLIDYILQGNHAVFEHPIPGVFRPVTTVVQVDVLVAFAIDPGGQCSLFDLRQDRLPLDDGV